MSEKVYRTGEGGIRQGRYWTWHTLAYFCLAILLLFFSPVFSWGAFDSQLLFVPLLVITGLLMVGAGIYSIMCHMREKNSQVTLGEERIAVRDWIGKTRDIELEAVSAVVWTTRSNRFCGETSILSVHAMDRSGYVLPVDIGYAYASAPEELEALREALVTRLDLKPTGPAGGGFWESLNRLIFGAESVYMWK